MRSFFLEASFLDAILCGLRFGGFFGPCFSSYIFEETTLFLVVQSLDHTTTWHAFQKRVEQLFPSNAGGHFLFGMNQTVSRGY